MIKGHIRICLYWAKKQQIISNICKNQIIYSHLRRDGMDMGVTCLENDTTTPFPPTWHVQDNEQKVLMSFILLGVVVCSPFPNEYFQPYRSLFPFSVWQSKHSFIFPSQWHLYLNYFTICVLVLVSITLCLKQQSINRSIY